MKKIAFLINSLDGGGAERVLVNLITQLNSRFEIEVVCLEKNNFYTTPKNVNVTYLSKYKGKENFFIKLCMLPVYAYKLKKYLKNNNINLVQSHLFRANYVNSLAKIFGSNHMTQLVSTVSFKSKYVNGSLSSLTNLLLIRYLYPKADVLIFKSLAMESDFLNYFSLKNQSLVINNPVDIEHITKLKLDKGNNNFHMKDDKKYIIYVGRFHKQKRQEDLVYAFRNLSQKYNDLELIFLGDGSEKKRIEQLVSDLNLNNRIHMMGRITNPYYYLSKAYLCVLTSVSEGFPNVLLESLCCNIPIVSTDCLTGPREILNYVSEEVMVKEMQEAEYGILVPTNNIMEVEKAIEFMLKKENYKKYKKRLSTRLKDFDINLIVKKYYTVLNK